MPRLPVSSQESVSAPRPVVDESELGARALGSSYWRAVEGSTRGLVRAQENGAGIALRLLGRGPALIALGPPELAAGNGRVACAYPIVGGLLVSRAGGSLSLEQVGGDPVVLRSTLTDYLPRLTGALYAQGQARLHAAVSRRYFTRLQRESA